MQEHLDQLDNLQSRLYNLAYNMREVRVAMYGYPAAAPTQGLKAAELAKEAPQCYDEKLCERIVSLHTALNEIEEIGAYLYGRLVGLSEGPARANR